MTTRADRRLLLYFGVAAAVATVAYCVAFAGLVVYVALLPLRP